MSVHLDLMLACLLGVLLAKPFLSSVGQGSPIVWLVKWKQGAQQGRAGQRPAPFLQLPSEQGRAGQLPERRPRGQGRAGQLPGRRPGGQGRAGALSWRVIVISIFIYLLN